MAVMMHWFSQLILGLAATAVGAYTVLPRINARIAEMTAAHEDRRTFRHKLTTIAGLCDRLLVFKAPADASKEVVARVEAEHERWRTLLDEHTIWLVDNLEWFAFGYLEQLGLRSLAEKYGVSARGVFLSDRPDEVKFQVLLDITRNAHAIFAARHGLSYAAKMRDNLATLRDQLDELGGLTTSTPGATPTAPTLPEQPAPAEVQAYSPRENDTTKR